MKRKLSIITNYSLLIIHLTMLLSDTSITNFIEKLSSKSPTPGGGGAAAVAGALAAALAGMMANLTLGKEKFAAVEQEMKVLEGELAVARAELLKLVDEDAKAYQMIMDGYALPKNTEQEKMLRSEYLAKAAQGAALVPLRICRHCVRVGELTERVAQIGNPGLLTDAACGAIMAAAALESAALNVAINLPMTHNEEFISDCKKQLAEYKAKVQDCKKAVLALVDKL